MGDNDASEARFKPVPASGTPRGPTVHVVQNPLTAIFAYVDEYNGPEGKRLVGSISFVPESGPSVGATLAACWFPPGTWFITLDANGEIIEDSVEWRFPPGRTAAHVREVLARAGQQQLLHWISKDPAALRKIEEMVSSAAYRSVRVVVAYSKHANGNSRSLPNVRPTSADVEVLSDPAIALVYLQFVEHFGKVPVNMALARDGLTRVELDQVEQDRPPIIEITNLFTQAAAEFNQVKASAPPPAVGITELRMMIETIFFQKGAQNDLAVRNLLQISIGGLVVRTGGVSSLVQDIGISQRDAPGTPMLLYDRFGRATRSYGGGYVDTEYRSVDMAKAERDLGIDGIKITVENAGLYAFLRSIEQQLGEPNREFAVIAVSLFRYWQYIRDFITAEYKAEIRARIFAFSAAAVGFFVAHAIALRFLPHPAAALFLLALKGAGMLFAVDFSFTNVPLLMEAGSHFIKLEEIQRLESAGKNKKGLTGLSRFHLIAGANALLEAMAEIVALGAVIVGGGAIGAGVKHGPALVKGLKSAPKRVRLVLEEGKAVVAKVEAMMGKTEIETVKNTTPPEQTGSISKPAEPTKPKPGEPTPKPKPKETKPPYQAPEDTVGTTDAYATATQKVEPPPKPIALTPLERIKIAITDRRLPQLEKDLAEVIRRNPDLKLTQEELLALRGYTSDVPHPTLGKPDYWNMNTALRTNEHAVLDLYQEYINHAISALRKLPVTQPTSSWLTREMELPVALARKLFKPDGKPFLDQGFFSTADGTGVFPNKNVHISIQGKNLHGRRVEKVSAFGEVPEPGVKVNEREFLFEPKVKFKKTYYEEIGDEVFVILEHM